MLTHSWMRTGAFMGLAAACLGLGFIIHQELETEARSATVTPAVGSSVPAAPPAETFAMPPLQAYEVVTRRPLFSSDRRPALAEFTSQPATNVSEFVLSGIIITESEKVALIADAHAGSLARYREGQVVGGWKLQSIEPDRIVLERGSQHQEIKLVDRSRTTVEGIPPRAPQRR